MENNPAPPWFGKKHQKKVWLPTVSFHLLSKRSIPCGCSPNALSAAVTENPAFPSCFDHDCSFFSPAISIRSWMSGTRVGGAMTTSFASIPAWPSDNPADIGKSQAASEIVQSSRAPVGNTRILQSDTSSNYIALTQINLINLNSYNEN